ncbi:hypothetical protein N7485_004744 [Penicillium canescens]|nr:hypothetical protein N7485_004744 [Penicillium canescens]
MGVICRGRSNAEAEDKHKLTGRIPDTTNPASRLQRHGVIQHEFFGDGCEGTSRLTREIGDVEKETLKERVRVSKDVQDDVGGEDSHLDLRRVLLRGFKAAK